MGIKGLTSLIKKLAPESITIKDYDSFKKNKIAIDTSILLYKFKYFNHDNEYFFINSFLRCCIRYLSYGILPIFILDGKPPSCKQEVLTKRYNQRKKIYKRIEDLKKKLNDGENVYNDIEKLNKQVINITKQNKEELKEFLEILGFTVIVSDGEAEATCAYLQQHNYVQHTFTDDTDALPLGCKTVLRSNGVSKFSKINLDIILSSLELSQSQFIDMCILCGCDYCPKIPKIGYMRAYNLIQKYKTIENVIESIKEEYNIPENYNFQEARDAFKLKSNKKFYIKENIIVDYKRYKDFLLNRGFDIHYINHYYKILQDKINYYSNLK